MVVPEKLLMKKIKKREKVKKQLANKQQSKQNEETSVVEPDCEFNLMKFSIPFFIQIPSFQLSLVNLLD